MKNIRSNRIPGVWILGMYKLSKEKLDCMSFWQLRIDDIFHWFLNKHINREDYIYMLNLLWTMFSDWLKDPKQSSLARRMDRRSLGEFALQIYDNTERENFLLYEWLRVYNKKVTVENYGIENSGRVVINPKFSQGKPDFILYQTINSWFVEVKFTPSLNKITFKENDLLSYLKYNAYILLFLSDRCMIGPNGKVEETKEMWNIPNSLFWSWIGPNDIEMILNESHVCSSEYEEVGGKRGFQFNKKQFEKMFAMNQLKE